MRIAVPKTPRSQEPPRRSAIAIAALTLLAVLTSASLVLVAQGVITYLNLSSEQYVAPEITSVVKIGTVEVTVPAVVTVAPRFETAVSVPQLAGSPVPVATKSGSAVGDRVGPGSVVAHIADRPIIVIPGIVPAYRPMSLGTYGADVSQLQSALSALGYSSRDPAGSFGPSTAIAVYSLYSDRGEKALDAGGYPIQSVRNAGSVVIAKGEIAFIPSLPATVTTQCGEQGLVATGTVCTISGGDIGVTVEVAAIDVSQIEEGFPVRASVAGVSFSGVLGTRLLAPATNGNASGTQQHEDPSDAVAFFAFTPDEALPEGLVARGTAEIVINASPAHSLIVQSSAIKQESGGTTWVYVKTAGQAPKRVEIEVLLCGLGQCAVDGAAALASGDVLVISGPSLDQVAGAEN